MGVPRPARLSATPPRLDPLGPVCRGSHLSVATKPCPASLSGRASHIRRLLARSHSRERGTLSAPSDSVTHPPSTLTAPLAGLPWAKVRKEIPIDDAATSSGSNEAVRVALDVSAVPPRPAGAGRYILELARSIARRADCHETLLSRRDDVRRWREIAPAARLVPVVPSSRPARLVYEQLRLGRQVRSLAAPAIDCYHGPHYTLPRRLAVPSVVTVHDLTLIEHPEWHERTKVAVFGAAIRYAAAHAAVTICVSETTAAKYRELCAPRGQVAVVPHGVDHARFSDRAAAAGADEATLRSLGLTAPYLLHLGTLEPRKGVADLVAAFSALAGNFAELELVLAGATGWGTGPVEAAIKASPARARIRRLGYLDDNAVPVLLRRSAAVVYPSLEEGFGLPALEALACGAPLVTSAGTAMADLAGATARLAPPGDSAALAEVLADVLGEDPSSPERTKRRAEGIEIASRFTWERTAAGHVAAYRLATGR